MSGKLRSKNPSSIEIFLVLMKIEKASSEGGISPAHFVDYHFEGFFLLIFLGISDRDERLDKMRRTSGIEPSAETLFEIFNSFQTKLLKSMRWPIIFAG